MSSRGSSYVEYISLHTIQSHFQFDEAALRSLERYLGVFMTPKGRWGRVHMWWMWRMGHPRIPYSLFRRWHAQYMHLHHDLEPSSPSTDLPEPF